MDIRRLRYFIAISEEPSISAASQRLGVAQPSLSQHVIHLEQELGVTLIERSPRGIALTEEGRMLARHAREICARVDHCVDSFRELRGTVRGPVALGIPPSISMVMLVPLVETVRIELPEVRLTAVESMSGYIRQWIEDESVDMGLLYNLEGAHHFRTTHLMDERLFFHAAPDNWPLETPPGRPVTLASIKDLGLILPSPSHGLRRVIDRYARERDTDLNVVVEMDAMTQIKELVARGSGFTILSAAAAFDFEKHGEIVKSLIVEPELVRHVYLATKPSKSRSRACRAVEEIALEVTRDIVSRGIWDGTLVDGAALPAAPSS